MNAVKKDVEELVVKELNSANEQFPLFASLHEGYAVMLEEFEEAEGELEWVRDHIDYMWKNVKQNNSETSVHFADCIKDYAINLACEAIQLAAMAEKVIVSEKNRTGIRICSTVAWKCDTAK